MNKSHLEALWKKRNHLLLFSLLAAALFLAICSKSSPLYPMNDWVDVHCFLTLGKGMLYGLVPYRDLYEQKGPVLYFLYAIVALFNRRSFLGQYLLEVITFGLFLYYSAKIAEIYLGNRWHRYLLIPVLAFVVGVSKPFSHGGSVEQICLFLFSYGLYTVLNACHQGRGLTKREAMINGILAGAAFWIKYTMMGFYAGLALFVLIWYLGTLRDKKLLLETIGRFLLGFGIVTGVVLLYFLLVGAVRDLFTCYFYNNLFLYPSESEESIFKIALNKVDAVLKNAPAFRLLIVLGLSYLLVWAKERPMDLTAVLMSLSALVLTTYMGKGYSYYGLVLSAYLIFGLIALASLAELIVHKTFPNGLSLPKLAQKLIICSLVLLCLGQTKSESQNTYLMDYSTIEMPQYQFAEYMHRTKDHPVLLNFGFLDGGFYYAADTLPSCRFFCTFNVNAPEMWDTQRAYVEAGAVDFVVTRNHTLEEYNIGSQYELVKTSSMYFEGKVYPYYLYALKETEALP